MSRDPHLKISGCETVQNLDALRDAIPHGARLFVIGGAELYRLFLPVADRIELTLIHRDFEGDTFFPEYAESEWKETQREDHPLDPELSFAWSYLTLERIV